MYQRVINSQRNYGYLDYVLPNIINDSQLLAVGKRNSIYAGRVIEKLKDNRYKVEITQLNKMEVIARRFLSDDVLKEGTPVWVVFESSDATLPLAIKAAVDDPIATTTTPAPSGTIKTSTVTIDQSREIAMVIDQQGFDAFQITRTPFSIPSPDTVAVVVQKGPTRKFIDLPQYHTTLNYSVFIDDSFRTFSKTKLDDGLDRQMRTVGRPVLKPPKPTDIENQVQVDKPVAYIPDLIINDYGDLLSLGFQEVSRKQEEDIANNTLRIRRQFVFSLEDFLREGFGANGLNLNEAIADRVQIYGSFIDVGIRKDRVLEVFRALIQRIQSLKAQSGFIASVKSGVIYEPVRQFIVKKFLSYDLDTRLLILKNISQYFLMIPDLMALKELFAMMSNFTIGRWFQDLGIDVSLITPLRQYNTLRKISEVTKLGEDQIREIIVKLGVSAGSAMQLFLLVVKAGEVFYQVIGQYLDTKITTNRDFVTYSKAVLALFGEPNSDVQNAVEKYNISFESLLAFINTGIDHRKPISREAFAALSILFGTDAYMYKEGMAVVGNRLLIQDFTAQDAIPILVPEESIYKQNLDKIFSDILNMLDRQFIEEIKTLDLGMVGRTAQHTRDALYHAINLLVMLIQELDINRRTVNEVLDNLVLPIQGTVNSFLTVLSHYFIVIMDKVIRTTQITKGNVRTILAWYSDRLKQFLTKLEKKQVEIIPAIPGSGWLVELDDKLVLHRRLSGFVEGTNGIRRLAINPRYPNFGLNTDNIPDFLSELKFSAELEMKELKVDEIPMIQVIKFRQSVDQPFKYYIVIKPTQMSFWVDGDNNVVIHGANRILLHGKDDIIIKSEKNIMMLAKQGILQLSGSASVPETIIQAVLVGNHVTASANNIIHFASEKIQQVSLARTARNL
jgi:hypothetical protein